MIDSAATIGMAADVCPFDADSFGACADAEWFDAWADAEWVDAARPGADRTEADGSGGKASPASMETVIGFALDDAVASQTMANQQAARQMFAIREAFQIARESPGIYVPVGVARNVPDLEEVDFAERSVAFDLAQRLHLSENTVRSMALQGEMLAASLPRLRELFVSGRIGPQHVRAAVEAAVGMADRAAAVAYDEKLAAIAEGLPPGAFARRCRLIRERLCVDTLPERHEEARARRRVSVEAAEDGMAWLNAYLPVMDAALVQARLAGTARRVRQQPGEDRTLDQVQADLLVAWLTGDTTTAASSVRPFVLIDDAGRFAELLGYGPLPPKTAARALRDAPAFRKVLADPVDPARGSRWIGRVTGRPRTSGPG